MKLLAPNAFSDCAAVICLIVCVGLLALSAASAAETNVVHVALVLDDGPFSDHAPKLLELFKREGIHVTFSLVATQTQANASTARAIVAAGHEVANHSYAHRHPKDLSDAELEQEIAGAQRIVAKESGFTPRWYWPPFIEIDDRVRSAAKKADIEVYPIRNLVVSADYDRAVDGDEIKRRATTRVTDGSVILFHEWRDETLTQLPAILAELRRQGCVFHTFSQLAAYNRAQDRPRD
jgi:peptidoglycan/xylan/chitin deacetylase (PgdA/CDA1 family)